MTPVEFIDKIKNDVISLKDQVLPSVTIAQAAQESAWGAKAPGNNLFGIKADKSWSGETMWLVTSEIFGGVRHVVQCKFRAYPDWKASITDHVAFLRKNLRYADCFKCKDALSFCEALQKAGYSTDPMYAHCLISIIDKYNLTQYDKEATC